MIQKNIRVKKMLLGEKKEIYIYKQNTKTLSKTLDQNSRAWKIQKKNIRKRC